MAALNTLSLSLYGCTYTILFSIYMAALTALSLPLYGCTHHTLSPSIWLTQHTLPPTIWLLSPRSLSLYMAAFNSFSPSIWLHFHAFSPSIWLHSTRPLSLYGCTYTILFLHLYGCTHRAFSFYMAAITTASPSIWLHSSYSLPSIWLHSTRFLPLYCCTLLAVSFYGFNHQGPSFYMVAQSTLRFLLLKAAHTMLSPYVWLHIPRFLALSPSTLYGCTTHAFSLSMVAITTVPPSMAVHNTLSLHLYGCTHHTLSPCIWLHSTTLSLPLYGCT
jgi:hypothetical protein